MRKAINIRKPKAKRHKHPKPAKYCLKRPALGNKRIECFLRDA